MVSETKWIIKMGKNNPLAAIQFPESFMALTWPKWTQQHPKIVGLFSHSLCKPILFFPSRVMRKTTTKPPNKDPIHWLLAKQLPSHGEKTQETVKTWMRVPRSSKNVDAWRNGKHFWGITFPISQKSFSQKWVFPQIRIWSAIPCPSHAITNLSNLWHN